MGCAWLLCCAPLQRPLSAVPVLSSAPASDDCGSRVGGRGGAGLGGGAEDATALPVHAMAESDDDDWEEEEDEQGERQSTALPSPPPAPAPAHAPPPPPPPLLSPAPPAADVTASPSSPAPPRAGGGGGGVVGVGAAAAAVGPQVVLALPALLSLPGLGGVEGGVTLLHDSSQAQRPSFTLLFLDSAKRSTAAAPPTVTAADAMRAPHLLCC